VTFEAITAANVVRAAMPPGRADDVFVVVPPLPGGEPTPERAAMTEVTNRETQEAVERADGRRITAVLGAFIPLEDPAALGASRRVAPGVWLGGAPTAPAAAVDPLGPTSPGAIVASSIAALVLLWFVGYGWARTAMDAAGAAALAPAFGLAAVAIAAIVAERLGVPLDRWLGPTAISALAGAGGYLCLLLLGRQRAAGAEPPSQVQQ
jgi:hypothetical protein